MNNTTSPSSFHAFVCALTCFDDALTEMTTRGEKEEGEEEEKSLSHSPISVASVVVFVVVVVRMGEHGHCAHA